MKIINLFIVALSITVVLAADDGDWVNPSNLPVQFAIHPFYAGYLNVGSSRSYFYVYHPSESNPSKDPLVVRVSAGPGCSSMYSWLYSKGPFIFTPGTLDFRINPQNWNKQANVLFIEGPAGVGFSIDKSGIQRNITDQQFSIEMVNALFSFYTKFPELKDQQLYLTGEQYSGITIPMMAKRIVQANNDPNTPIWQKIKLKGFLLQNPCTMGDQCDSHFQYTHYTMQYLKNHYFISKQKYQQFLHHCTVSQTSQYCLSMKHQIQAAFVNTGSDITNIYRECIKQTGPQKYKCLDIAGIIAFMQNKHVIQDLHVDQNAQTWDLCNLTIMEHFKRDPLGSLHIYEQLLRQQHDLRIWIVSGTHSASVPTLGTRKWVESLKQTLRRPATRVWDAWKYDHDINAGSIQEFPGLTFVSVRAAGAKIYRDQPQIGFYIYDSFVKGRRL